MESVFYATASASESLFDMFWFPVVLWTVITALVLICLKGLENRVHSQYHHHFRLALILALPVGVLTSWILQHLSAASETSYIIVSVMAPIEVGVSEISTETGFAPMEILYAALMIIFIAGLVYFGGRYLWQWIHLFALKNRKNEFHHIESVPELDLTTLGLAQSTGKKVLIGFSAKEIIPVTFGTIQPVILLPLSLRESPKKLNLAVRHELTHISQNDFSIHLLVTAVKSVFWFHPFVHILSAQIADYREMRCDSLVLSDRSVSKKEYASLLLELLPSANLNRGISVNMAQESSKLKKRIQMMNQNHLKTRIPGRSAIAMLSVLLAIIVTAMACTDMQSHNVFDEEDLDLMTDVDRTGERGYHQIIIFMGDEEQDERHKEALSKLDQLSPEHISKIEVLKGENAVQKYGERATYGVILIKTKQDPESYNTVLNALGMQDVSPPPVPTDAANTTEDYFVVVEQMPELIGGLEKIQQSIHYPETARRAGIEGRVYVQFIVNEDGDVEDPKVIRGIGGGADEEAVRAVRQAKFKPGVQRGRNVRVQYSLPIFFRLSGPSVENPEVSEKNFRLENLEHSGDIIRGTVIDAESGEPLAGANVTLTDTNEGTATNQDGIFSLSGVDSEASQIRISYVGYKTATANL